MSVRGNEVDDGLETEDCLVVVVIWEYPYVCDNTWHVSPLDSTDEEYS